MVAAARVAPAGSVAGLAAVAWVVGTAVVAAGRTGRARTAVGMVVTVAAAGAWVGVDLEGLVSAGASADTEGGLVAEMAASLSSPSASAEERTGRCRAG
eukprot:2514983-Prymnesium_polylepis.1